MIGRPAFRVSAEHALEHVAGYTIANDITDPATWSSARTCGDRHRLAARQERARLHPARAVPRARRVRRRPGRPAGHAAAQRRGHAGRVHQGHDLRRRRGSSPSSRRPCRCSPATWCSPAARPATACTGAACCATATSWRASITGLGVQRTRCVAEEDAMSPRPHQRPGGRDRRGREDVLQLGALGRGRRARHAELHRRGQAPRRPPPWSARACQLLAVAVAST